MPDPEPKEQAVISKRAIGVYLGVSERTVVRYIEKYGLPVYRQGGLTIAFPSELDNWRRGEHKQKKGESDES